MLVHDVQNPSIAVSHAFASDVTPESDDCSNATTEPVPTLRCQT